MLNPRVKITRITEDRRYPAGSVEGVWYERIEFMVDNHGPFTEKILKSEYSIAALENKLNAWADTIPE